MAECIGIPFGLSMMGPRNHKLHWGADSSTGRGNFGVDMGQTVVTNGENMALAIPAVQPVPK